MKGAWHAIGLLAGAVLLGCGGPGVDTAKVSGKVTVAGAPMEGITVSFQPASGRPASGVTDASGNFTLATFSKGDGAVPGKHKVSFIFSTMPRLGPDGKPPVGGGPDNIQTGKPGSSPSKAPPLPSGPPAPFNSKYTRGDSSGIEAEVVAGKSNEFSWDLEK